MEISDFPHLATLPCWVSFFAHECKSCTTENLEMCLGPNFARSIGGMWQVVAANIKAFNKASKKLLPVLSRENC